jgi:uncharacterized protein (DUF433 family)
MTDQHHDHIEVVEGAGGPKARIVGTRIRVEDVVAWHEKQGLSPDEILHQYPSLTLADVYAALTYYWDHKEQIDRQMAEGQAFVEEFRRSNVGPLEKKLARRRA